VGAPGVQRAERRQAGEPRGAAVDDGERPARDDPQEAARPRARRAELRDPDGPGQAVGGGRPRADRPVRAVEREPLAAQGPDGLRRPELPRAGRVAVRGQDHVPHAEEVEQVRKLAGQHRSCVTRSSTAHWSSTARRSAYGVSARAATGRSMRTGRSGSIVPPHSAYAKSCPGSCSTRVSVPRASSARAACS
jgi:hypothetical protein